MEMDAAARAISVTSDGGLDLKLTPFVDGDVIPTPVLAALRSGAGADIPLLLGATSHEFNFAGRGVPPDLAPEALAGALVGLGIDEDEAARLVAAHAGPAGALFGQTVTDRNFRRLALAVAQVRSPTPAPTWLYQFAWPSPVTGGLAFHCLDLPFWFDLLHGERVAEAAGSQPPQLLADAMHAAMVRFIRGEAPGWASYGDGATTMTWAATPTTDADPYADVIGAFKTVGS